MSAVIENKAKSLFYSLNFLDLEILFHADIQFEYVYFM